MGSKPSPEGDKGAVANGDDSGISAAAKAAAEEQIVKHHRTIDYDTREYPVEVLVQKYLTRLDEEDNDLFVPDYQREHTWPEEQQSKFIESVLIGLPIPYLFVADIPDKEGRLEIVDGSQRIRTLADFIGNKLQLSGLKKLSALNGFRFKDLPISRQRRFNRHTLRMIELTENADEEVRRDIFERINTGSQALTDMEVRWGMHDSPFLKFIRACSENPLFAKLAPLNDAAVKRRERQEFVLRFFAYLENYRKFDRKVVDFLNEYLAGVQKRFVEDVELQGAMQEEWDRMLAFVRDHFPNGFSKAKGYVRTPRIRYEAISVGTALALREKPELKPRSTDWIESAKFKALTTSDASNSRPKVVGRIEYVRDKLLGK
ncbi:MAG TPA: DUF262 domain-containing protein [Tepidisphaeraceae bacterium]|jgi:hypothetical protein